MSKITPEIIGYIYVDNMHNGKENMRAMGKAKFGDKWMGFVKEMSYVHSEGFMTKILTPISGSPAAAFTEAIEKSGLVGFQF